MRPQGSLVQLKGSFQAKSFKMALVGNRGLDEESIKRRVHLNEKRHPKGLNQVKNCRGRPPLEIFLEDRRLANEKDLSKLTDRLVA